MVDMRKTKIDCTGIQTDKEEKVSVPLFFEEFAWENEHYKFYYNDWCDQFRKNLSQYDNHGYTVDVKKVYLAKSKKGNERFYVAYNTLGKPILTWKDSWDFELQTILYKSMLREDDNIINMAKKRNEQ